MAQNDGQEESCHRNTDKKEKITIYQRAIYFRRTDMGQMINGIHQPIGGENARCFYDEIRKQKARNKNTCRVMRQALKVICCSCDGCNLHKASDSFRGLSCRPCSTGLYGRPAFLQFQNADHISGKYPFDARMQYAPFSD